MLTKEIKQSIATLLVDPQADKRRQAAEDLSSTSSLMISAILSLALQDKDKGVRDSAARSLLEIQSPSVPYAIVEYLTDSSFVTRNLASNLLAKKGSNSLGALIPYFKYENQDVRKLALDTVGLIGDRRALPEIIPMLCDQDENVVVAAIEAMGNICDASAIPHLSMAYVCHPYARVVIAEAIGKIGDSSASTFLAALLRDVENPQGEDLLVTFAVAEALGAVGTEASLPSVLELVKKFDGKLRHIVLYAFVSIIERHALSKSDFEQFRDLFIDALNDDDQKIVSASTKALVTMLDDEIEDRLLQVLGMSEEIDTLILMNLRNGRKAFVMLTKKYDHADTLQKKTILKFLLTHLQENMHQWFHDINHDTMKDLQNSISTFFDNLALDWNDADEETRIDIMDALFYLDQDRALTYFTQLAEDADPWIRMQFLEQVAGASHMRSNDLLAKFAHDENDFVREFVVSILQSRGMSIENSEIIE